MTNEGGKTCPVCTEEMDLTDLQLKPCKCGYEVCVWCWHHIMDMAEKDGTEGRCPACRSPYDKEKIVSMAASVEINTERKQKPQKAKSKTNEGRKQFTNVRVVQRHLVYTMGIPANLADEDVLQRREYFGQYGKVLKASLTRTSGGAIQYSTNNTCSVYITYSKEEEAERCIQSVHGYILQGQPLKACFGTTKYCHAWLRNMPCSNPECVYLHDVGIQEDSFAKDEVVPANTRNKVQQITAASNLEHRSGNVLPPPIDEPYITGTVSAKPLSRSPSDNHPSQLKISPPGSSSGRSISLPAAASWGLRVSNGDQPTATSVSSNGPSKQKHQDYSSSVGFPSLVAYSSSGSTLHADVGKKAWVTKDGASNSGKELRSSEYSKQYAVMDRQKSMPGSVGVVQDATPTRVFSRDLPSLATSRDDKKSLNLARSVETDPQSCNSYLDKDGSIAVNGKVKSVQSLSSPVGIDSYHSSDHSDATESNRSISNQLYRSFSNQGLQSSYSEHASQRLTSLPPRNVVSSDGVYVSRDSSNWGSELQQQVLQDTHSVPQHDLRAMGEQNSNISEVCHPLLSNHRSSQSKISSSFNPSWPNDSASGTSEPIGRDPSAVHTKADIDVLPFTSSDSISQNGYGGNNMSTSAEMETNFEQSNLLLSVEKGKYPGRDFNNSVNFDRNVSADLGESSIISNILSLDFDPWDDSLASPHNVAKLLGETDKQLGGLKISSSQTEQKSNQSRFSFARQVDYADKEMDSDISHNIQNAKNSSSASQLFQDNQNVHLNDLPSGLSYNFLEESDSLYSGTANISSNRFSGSRAPASAPPGFSAPSKIPPPGFSVHERRDTSFDAASANHYMGSSSQLRSQYNVQPTMGLTNFEDLEFMDPAILAVGAGRPANVMNDFPLDIRSSPMQIGSVENDPRIQLLRQQFLPPQQNFRYSDHIGDRFSPVTDTYNMSSMYLDQAQFAQLSHQQPRADHFSHGWNSWNEAQSGNDLGTLDFFKNERYGFNQYFPEYDNRNSRMPNPNDLYNKTFGM